MSITRALSASDSVRFCSLVCNIIAQGFRQSRLYRQTSGSVGLSRYGRKRGIEQLGKPTDGFASNAGGGATISAQALKDLQDKYQASEGAQRLLAFRHRLPSFSMREQIIAALQHNQACSLP
jgi:hypothetical protein